MDAASAMTTVQAIYYSAGSLVPGILAVTLYVLEALLSCVLGMPFFSASNPVIDYDGHTVTFGSLVVLC